jgi:hypothetical protein
MDVSNACQPRNTARSARDESSVVAFPSERRLSPRSDRSLGVSPADRRAGLAACEPMHRNLRSARRSKCWTGRMTDRPRYSAKRAKVGFGGEFGGSRAARADGAGLWAWNRRAEQLPRMERDRAAHTTALGTADAAKWVNRQEYCLTQPRATISMGISTGPRGRSVTEAAEQCLGPLPIGNAQLGKVDNSGFLSCIRPNLSHGLSRHGADRVRVHRLPGF